ncbi:hypothetical protein EDB85DRAFT_1900562 [Lactarius pseudohatsudake]|nr:hypothetical protein EDB85DRAFT_1900562 [Lactarius pseudohatsudake]
MSNATNSGERMTTRGDAEEKMSKVMAIVRSGGLEEDSRQENSKAVKKSGEASTGKASTGKASTSKASKKDAHDCVACRTATARTATTHTSTKCGASQLRPHAPRPSAARHAATARTATYVARHNCDRTHLDLVRRVILRLRTLRPRARTPTHQHQTIPDRTATATYEARTACGTGQRRPKGNHIPPNGWTAATYMISMARQVIQTIQDPRNTTWARPKKKSAQQAWYESKRAREQ